MLLEQTCGLVTSLESIPAKVDRSLVEENVLLQICLQQPVRTQLSAIFLMIMLVGLFITTYL